MDKDGMKALPWSSSCPYFLLLVSLLVISSPKAYSWSKEGHIITCQIAQAFLLPEAAEAVKNLLPAYANGDLSAGCSWPDQIRHWYRYRWTDSLHFIDTPDDACSYDYSRDCHDPHGIKGVCISGAIRNFTSQLMHYRQGTSDRLHNLTEALLFLSHFMGDIHQPLHVGFTGDKGGNTIQLRWFKHKSNLHHVWDREIILTAIRELYGEKMDHFKDDILNNITQGIWSVHISSWEHCEDILSCQNDYAAEGIHLACKWAYRDVEPGDTLSDDYFNSRFPIVTRRIAQGGMRLAMTLNKVFGDRTKKYHLHPDL